MLRFFSSLLFASLLAGAPLAQTVTWTGGGDGSTWSDGANWSTGSAPGAGNDVVLDLRDAATVMDSPRTIGSLSLTAINTSIALNAPLAVSGDMFFDHSSARISGPSDLTIGGRLRWESGTFQSDPGSPATILARGGVAITGTAASSSNDKTLDGSRLVLPSGTETTIAAARFFGANGGTLEVQEGATLNIPDARSNVFSVVSGSEILPRLVLAGALTASEEDFQIDVRWAAQVSGSVTVASPETTLSFQGPLEDQNGTYAADTGTLILAPPNGTPVVFGESSQILVGAGATLRLARGEFEPRGLLDNGGTLALGTSPFIGGSVSVTLPASLSIERLGGEELRIGQRATVTSLRTAPLSVASLFIDFRGELFLRGPLAVAGDVTLQDQTSVLDTPEAVTVGGRITWRGGRVTGGGTVTANGGIDFVGNIASASFNKFLDDATLVLPEGTESIYDAWYFFGANGARLLIEEGAVLSAIVGQMSSSFAVENGSDVPPIFDLDGTFIRTNATFPGFRLDWDAEISGELRLDTDNEELQIRGALTDQGGTYRVNAGRFFFGIPDGTSATLTPQSQVLVASGATLGLARGEVIVQGVLDNAGSLELQNASGLGSNSGGTLIIQEGAGLERLAAEGALVAGRNRLRIEEGFAPTVPALTLDASGTLDLGSDFVVTGAFEHLNAGATVTGPAAFTVRGETTWTGGTHAGTGESRFEGNVTAIRDGGSASWYKRIDGRTVTLASGVTAAWTGSARTSVAGGGRLIVEPGATIDLSASGADWRAEGDGGTLDVHGHGPVRPANSGGL